MVEMNWSYTPMTPAEKADKLASAKALVKNILARIATAAENAAKADLTALRPSAAVTQRAAAVASEMLALLGALKKVMGESLAARKSATEGYLGLSDPGAPTGNDAVVRQLRNVECRAILRSADPAKRITAIQGELKRGDLSFLWACMDSPDELLTADAIHALRREWAGQNFGDSIATFEKDWTEIADALRTIAHDCYHTAMASLSTHGIESGLDLREVGVVLWPGDPRQLAAAEQLERERQSKPSPFESWERDGGRRTVLGDPAELMRAGRQQMEDRKAAKAAAEATPAV